MNNRNQKYFFTAMAALLLTALISSHAQAYDTYNWIDPPQLYKITNHPETGFFRKVHSVVINVKEGLVYILHDTPISMSSFRVQDGSPRAHREFSPAMEEPASLAAFNDSVYVINKRNLWAVNAYGELVRPEMFAAKDSGKEKGREEDKAPQKDDGKDNGGQNGKDGGSKNDMNNANVKPAPTVDLAAGYMDRIWLADTVNKTIVKYNSNGDAETSNSSDAGAGGETGVPIEWIAAAFPDVLFALDSRTGTIHEYDGAGKRTAVIGLQTDDGDASGSFNSIAVDSSNRIWVSNIKDHTIDCYNPLGSLIYRIRNFANTGIRFMIPAKLAVFESSKLFVTDDGDASIKVFDISNTH